MAAKKRFKGARRDGGRFVAIPQVVLESSAYLSLSHTARSLLVEVAMQFHGDDNGRMLLSSAFLEPRGWRSPATILRAKADLLEAGFIFETVKGCRPNKASWYALTWLPLDRLDGFDPGVTAAFERSAYLRKNAALTTSEVVGAPSIATSQVVGDHRSTTSEVAMQASRPLSPTT